ncbi:MULTISPECIES: MarR family winged helix-turn-helix transcriptional regulator [Gordonibacter]|uniref:MarR family transcriptional regulator n=1 Tax=Gordonibacter faecis TaxID=3047475 RepID=A0ABT7DRC6_9ACTN|nr:MULTISPECIES: MarR family transcriptional regulator [unclassified Gordonibacter]MDJ1651076.1 MarR family transcriptional regulator [Gordonibacter sp. KGMB12511]HIW75380.1 MarR family transcriptional regulator [Candidatus Gordonibacter avicola]
MDARNARANREYNNLYRLSNELYHNVAVRMGLSDSAFDILYALDDLGDGCSQKEVCVASGLSKQTVNSSVHQLVRSGALELRTEGGRGTHLHLTKAGHALVARCIHPVVKAEEAAFGALTPKECDTLLCLSRRYLDAFRSELEALPTTKGGEA